MFKLWPVLHKSIFKCLRGNIRWALVMNETLLITSAVLTQNSWQPLQYHAFSNQQHLWYRCQGNHCANYAVMTRVENLAREFSFHVFWKASLKREQYTIHTVHPVTPWLELCSFWLWGWLNFLILGLGWYTLKGFGTHSTHYILECSRQLYNILSYIWANLFLTNTVSLFQHFLFKEQKRKNILC